MAIDNLELIKKLLVFPSKDTFYFCQILKRKKEHPELGSNNYVAKTYYINSIESLDRDYEEMKCLANFHNARVCINLNARSFEKLAFQNLKKVADQIMNKDYYSIKKAYNTVCGQYATESKKKWIIDIDTKNLSVVTGVIDELSRMHSEAANGTAEVYATISTKNGFHVICAPFHLDSRYVDDKILIHDIHKDNPTILYQPLFPSS